MKFTTPLPQPLPQECLKASKIFKSFVQSGGNGLDKVVPRSVLQQAKGFVIFTVVKAGFVFSARAGSGLVIARLPDGTFSAPSAIGTAGMGFGGQAGAELTEFLIVLNSTSALRSFMSAGSLTLGGNLSLAVGPLGRNGEAMGALNTKGKVAAMYSYSKTKGLFGGVSIEGSIIVERQDANAIAYQSDVTAKQLLSGNIPPPHWADGLIQILTQTVGDPIPGWVDDDPMSPNSERPSLSSRPSDYSFQGIGSTPSRSSEGVLARGHKKAMSLNPFNKKPSNEFDSGSRAAAGNDGYSGRSSLGSSSRRDWSPPRSTPAPPKPAGPAFDGFAEDEDDNSWKTPPGFGPQATSTSTSTSWYPRTQVPPVSSTSTSWYPNSRSPPQTTPSATSGSIFPTHFESDFVPDAPTPVSSHSRSFTPSYGKTQPISEPMPSTNNATSPFSYREEPQPPQYTATPSLVSPTPVGKTWSDPDPFRFDERRADSPPPTSQSRMSNKPARKLSVKRGLDAPAPPGTVKVIALFDYSATESKPLLIYHSAFPSDVSASDIESHLSNVGIVDPQWRYSMYKTTHYHSTTHEVLCIASGRAKLCFGGEENPENVTPTVQTGDVIILPAGVGHRLLEEIESPFQMVGSYPKGFSWDMCYGKEGDEAKAKQIEKLGWFDKDPVYGEEGPALEV
ncbi:hypothetical protein FRC04_000346 [Tulasnella sp. 424]|nr:hypothetical protein FRC04_000346 [Tulasnella sp. 424]KAG8973304.1 hypothetical protein FRC05_008848 [Tulasnella sp. 425]